jgi:hypothetical protein
LTSPSQEPPPRGDEPVPGATPRFWSVVKANVSAAGSHREQEFNRWYDAEHVPEWVSKPGFIRAWRLRALPHPRQEGTHHHTYYAIYELRSIDSFNRAIAQSQGAPWGPWQQYVGDHLLDWERTYYQVLCSINPEHTDAPHWAIVKTDFHGNEEEEREFNEWYDRTHLPELASHEGFQGGWRLRMEPDDGDLGERRQRYWAVYRVAHIEQFLNARCARAMRGLPPWDGLWSANLRNTEFNFYELLHYETSGDGVSLAGGSETAGGNEAAGGSEE